MNYLLKNLNLKKEKHRSSDFTGKSKYEDVRRLQGHRTQETESGRGVSEFEDQASNPYSPTEFGDEDQAMKDVDEKEDGTAWNSSWA